MIVLYYFLDFALMSVIGYGMYSLNIPARVKLACITLVSVCSSIYAFDTIVKCHNTTLGLMYSKNNDVVGTTSNNLNLSKVPLYILQYTSTLLTAIGIEFVKWIGHFHQLLADIGTFFYEWGSWIFISFVSGPFDLIMSAIILALKQAGHHAVVYVEWIKKAGDIIFNMLTESKDEAIKKWIGNDDDLVTVRNKAFLLNIMYFLIVIVPFTAFIYWVGKKWILPRLDKPGQSIIKAMIKVVINPETGKREVRFVDEPRHEMAEERENDDNTIVSEKKKHHHHHHRQKRTFD